MEQYQNIYNGCQFRVLDAFNTMEVGKVELHMCWIPSIPNQPNEMLCAKHPDNVFAERLDNKVSTSQFTFRLYFYRGDFFARLSGITDKWKHNRESSRNAMEGNRPFWFCDGQTGMFYFDHPTGSKYSVAFETGAANGVADINCRLQLFQVEQRPFHYSIGLNDHANAFGSFKVNGGNVQLFELS